MTKKTLIKQKTQEKIMVSVILVCYNAAEFLQVSIKSILQQNFAFIELIIIDDGSTDETQNTIKAFQDPRLKFFQLKNNCGIAQARNYGLMLATGKYIAIMDADDQAHPNRLGAQVKYLENNPEIGIVGTQVIKVIGKKKILMKYRDNDAIIKSRLLAMNGSALIHPSTMFRRSIVEKLFVNYPGTKTDVDHHMWFLAAKRGVNFGVVEEPLLLYRRHGKNITSEFSDDAESHEARKKELRTEIFCFYFPNIARSLASKVAELLNPKYNPGRLNITDDEYQCILSAINDSKSVIGESREELKKIVTAALNRKIVS